MSLELIQLGFVLRLQILGVLANVWEERLRTEHIRQHISILTELILRSVEP